MLKQFLNNKSMLLSYLTMLFMGHPGPLFHLFSFITHNFTKKIVNLSGTRNCIKELHGYHGLTTTTALT